MDRIQEMLGHSEQAKEMAALWQEYEDAQTPEALFVKDLDKFEMLVQAVEYEKCKYLMATHQRIALTILMFVVADEKSLESFFANTLGKFQHPLVKSWIEALLQERRQLAAAKKSNSA
jgi:putative hydrolase of HD superfamily